MTNEDICRAICRGNGTAQCAPLCLQHSSTSTTNGKCPEVVTVWGLKVKTDIVLQWLLKGLNK